tara:strand:+ start:1267 stop:1443 length:177 start_codon:yes stop_codon:yes gene_type:complete
MQVGSLVRYRKEYPDGMKIDWVGIVIDNTRVGGAPILVQYSNGMRHWKQPNDLEVIDG